MSDPAPAAAPTGAGEPAAADAPAGRLVIVLWAAGPARPHLVAAPFVYALTARALELDVEMHFTADTVRWLVPGVAETAHTDAAQTRTVAQYLDEAAAAGVRLYACAMARHEHARDTALRAGVSGVAGAATMLGAAIAPGTRVLVF